MADEKSKKPTNPISDEIAAMLGGATKETEDAKDDTKQADDEEGLDDGDTGDDGEDGDEEGEDDADDDDEADEGEEDYGSGDDGGSDDDEEDELDETFDEDGEDGADDVASLKRQVDALRLQLDKQMGRPARKEEPAAKPVESPPELPALNIEISDEDYDKALESKEGLIGILQKMGSFVFQESYAAAMKRLPGLVSQEVGRESSHQQMVNDFYEANPELRTVKKFVAFTFEQVLAEQPELDYTEAFAETAKRVRASVGMVRGGSGKRSRRRRKGGGNGAPNLPAGSGGGRSPRRTPNRPSSIADEIAMMQRRR